MSTAKIIGVIAFGYGVLNVVSFLFLPSDDPNLVFARKYTLTAALEAALPFAIGIYLIFIRKPKKQVETRDQSFPQFS